MKKTVKIIFLMIFMWGMLAIISKTSAASANISASKTTATVGDKVTVTVSINAAAWNLSVSGSATDSIVGYNADGVNQSTTKTYEVTSNKAGTCTVSLNGDVTDGTTDVNSPINGSVTITFKAKSTNSGSNNNGSSGNNNSSGNSGNSSGGSTTTKTPTFTSTNKTVYTKSDCNLRSSWSTSSAATSVQAGTELKLTGTSTETIGGYVWYRVTYNGTTKYIASSLITETKPKDDDDNKDDEKSSNKNLSSLEIEGVELTPEFNKDTTQYTAKVDGDVRELKIDSKAEDSKSKVTVEGNTDLKEGDNVIKVKVTAEDDTTRTYFITVTVGEGTQTDEGLKLSELRIERVEFENFKPDTYNYKLSLNSYVDKLDIIATPSQADATIEITGNNDFKVGTNIVTILLTSADGSETVTYQIEVNVPEGLITETKEMSTSMYIIIGVAAAIVIIAIIVFIVRHRVNQYEDSDEISDEELDKNELYGRKKSDVTVDELTNNPDDNKPKKSKGRHSI